MKDDYGDDFKPLPRRKISCSDRTCGAEDCETCYPGNAAGEPEPEPQKTLKALFRGGPIDGHEVKLPEPHTLIKVYCDPTVTAYLRLSAGVITPDFEAGEASEYELILGPTKDGRCLYRFKQ